MKPRTGELGNYNPYTGEYEAALTPEERMEEFSREHEKDGEDLVGIETSDLHDGDLLDEASQPDTYNPRTGRFEKAGYGKDE